MNSFGFGGTNVHVVLDDVESYLQHSGLASNGTSNGTDGYLIGSSTSGTNEQPVSPGTNSHTQTELVAPKLLLLSAADENGCHRFAESLSKYLDLRDNKNEMDDMAFTLNSRRTSLPWKSFAVVQCSRSTEGLEDIISKPVRREDAASTLAFVFTGQGAQWTGMGRELLGWPIFLHSVLKSQAYIERLNCSWSLIGPFSLALPPILY